jgi:hypothetical protein
MFSKSTDLGGKEETNEIIGGWRKQIIEAIVGIKKAI